METPKIKTSDGELATRITMGTYVRFKRDAGFDILTHPEKIDSEAMARLAYAAVRTAAEENGDKMPKDFDTFLDTVEPAAVTGFFTAALGQDGKESEGSDEEKKSL